METFTASNGVSIRRVGGRLEFPGAAFKPALGLHPQIDEAVTAAIAEFFRAEEDGRLLRFRDESEPGYVVYPVDEDTVRVLRESDGESFKWRRLDARRACRDGDRGGAVSAAVAYFDAHLKPWDSAEEGEIWVLTGAGGLEQPWRRINNQWISLTRTERVYAADFATAGRRIWPEVQL